MPLSHAENKRAVLLVGGAVVILVLAFLLVWLATSSGPKHLNAAPSGHAARRSATKHPGSSTSTTSAAPASTSPSTSTTALTPTSTPSTTAPAHTAAPATATTTTTAGQAPPPTTSTTAPASSTTAPPQTVTRCYKSPQGTCYSAGQPCPSNLHGSTVISSDGAAITCVDKNGWYWEDV